MSKRMGKLLLDNEIYKKKAFVGNGCFIRYVAGHFIIRVGKMKRRVRVCELLLESMMSEGPWCEFLYKWSYGYKTREYENNMVRVRDGEMKWLATICGCDQEVVNRRGGRYALVMDGLLECDEDFDIVCIIQYLYNFSSGDLKEAKKQKKRKGWGRSDSSWWELKLSKGYKGRKKGTGRGKVHEYEESLVDFMSRVEHNQKIAVEKGILGWYLDMEREKARRFGKRFGKEEKKKALDEWKKKRNEK